MKTIKDRQILMAADFAGYPYEGHLAPIVEADDFFDSIVPVQDLMGLPR